MSKISILMEIFGKSQICSKFSNNLDLGQNGRKISISVITYQNVDFGQNWRKFWFQSKFSKNVDLGQNLPNCQIADQNICNFFLPKSTFSKILT